MPTGSLLAAPEGIDGFLALLNAGNGNNNIFPGNGGSENNDGTGNNQPASNNAANAPVNVPTSLFAANNSANAPAPQSQPQPAPQKAGLPAADNQANNENNNENNNQTQNANNASAPVLKSSSQTNNGNQNAASSASNQSSAQVAQGQVTSANTLQAARQLRTQIQNQLDDISQMLLSMIQALSGASAQPVPAANVSVMGATPLSQAGAAGSDPAGSAADGQAGSGSPSDQEIALLKDMQSLLQQLQQSLPGQGQSGQSQDSQDNVQTLSDSLLSDMTKLSQLANQPVSAGDANIAGSQVNTTQFQDLSSLLKTSIAQTKAQLQALQNDNQAIFTQAINDLQPTPVDFSAPSKSAQDNNHALNATSNNAPVLTSNAPAAPVTQDVTIKAASDALLFNAVAPVQANVSQGGNNSAGNGNQDSGQNQAAQPVTAAASSPSTAPLASASGASFTQVLNQVSQSDVLDQVHFQVKTALADGSSKITIQLNPPELGKVDVKIEVGADGKTSGVTIMADNKNTLDLLQRDTQGLTRALNDAGLTTDSGSLSFSLNGGGQQNQAQTGSQQAAATYQQAQPVEERAGHQCHIQELRRQSGRRPGHYYLEENLMSTVNPTTTSNSVASAAAASNAQAQQSLNSNYTEFLSLLTTQLQNQDPTNPADTNQLTQEIAQLGEVQGQLQTNTYLAQLLSLMSSNQTSSAVSYIGKQIDAGGTPAQTELSSSQATLVYNLPAGASTSNVTITNSAGQTVFLRPRDDRCRTQPGGVERREQHHRCNCAGRHLYVYRYRCRFQRHGAYRNAADHRHRAVRRQPERNDLPVARRNTFRAAHQCAGGV